MLICGDAAHLRRQLDEIVGMTIMQDAAGFRRSLAMIHRHLADHPGTVAIPGHDPRAWAGLDDVY